MNVSNRVPEQLENKGLNYMGKRFLNNMYRISIVVNTDAHISIILCNAQILNECLYQAPF